MTRAVDNSSVLPSKLSPVDRWSAVMLLAMLGQPSDLVRFESLGNDSQLGTRRFQAIGAFGNPRLVNLLLDGIHNDDSTIAVAAGEAFTKITGAEIDSDTIVEIPPLKTDEQSDESNVAIPDEAILPDANLARSYWEEVRESFLQGNRWCHGFEISERTSDEILRRLDLMSRWETCLRENYYGLRQVSPIDLMRFPQIGL